MAPHSRNYKNGCILVMFQESETKESAEKFVESLGLTAINWNKLLNMLVVGVPVGEEQRWKERISRYKIVKHASLNSKVRLIE